MSEPNIYPTHCCHGVSVGESCAECRAADLARPSYIYGPRSTAEARVALQRLCEHREPTAQHLDVAAISDTITERDELRQQIGGAFSALREAGWTSAPVSLEESVRKLAAERDAARSDAARDELKEQIDRLAKFMVEVPGEPSQNEGAVDCAIRIIETLIGTRSSGRTGPA